MHFKAKQEVDSHQTQPTSVESTWTEEEEEEELLIKKMHSKTFDTNEQMFFHLHIQLQTAH